MIMSTSIALYLILIISCGFVQCLGTVYTVGDTTGWTLGVDYATWASGKNFLPGDSLVFNYPTGPTGHTVDEVTSSDYSACTVGNSIKSDSSGATTVQLTAAGTRNFICGTAGHCSGGMKLSITVKASSGTSPPSNTTTPSTPETPATTTNTPPATTANNLPSSSTGLTPFAVGMICAWAAIGALY